MRSPVPHIPGTPWPPRRSARSLASFVGATELEVVAALGEPDERTAGSVWGTSGGSGVTVLGAGGKVLDGVAVFGPAPRAIGRLVPYETWSYHNVGDELWLLYLGLPGARPSVPHEIPAPGWRDRLRNLFRRGQPRDWRPAVRVVLEVAAQPER
ncbi:MAG: hypothetical protein IT373_16495 [Polyangiaceae bacterium]|nr:hypothetical protein [Polyangiaceae bacterium]